MYVLVYVDLYVDVDILCTYVHLSLYIYTHKYLCVYYIYISS